MDLPDADLARLLLERDGPQPERYSRHRAGGDCRYADLYPDTPCPWCEAEQRRRDREAASTEATVESPQLRG